MAETPTDSPPETEGEKAIEEVADDRHYRRRIGMLLAILALLGAWIAVLQTNASTNESETAREATRLAARSQRAQVVEHGVESGIDEVQAQIDGLSDRGTFKVIDDAASDLGVPLDPQRAASRLEEASEEVSGALGDAQNRIRATREVAQAASLLQTAVVEERVTWNARASQYETVVTTLGVAIFLIGFTLVVARRVRPPIVVPGLILAVYCLGWSLHIYMKPIPDVDRDAITAVAAGDVALDDGRSDDALEDFDSAIDIDEDYAPGWEGRAMARLLEANPDLLRTVAIVDDSADVLAPATVDVDTALDLQADPTAETLSSAAVVALVSADWNRAEELLDEAIETNRLTPSLRLWKAAVTVAQGDEDAALGQVESTFEEFDDLRASDTARKLVAQHLSLLEWVEFNGADPEIVAAVRSRVIELVSEARSEDPLVDVDPDDVELTVRRAEFAEGGTDVAFDVSGVDEDAVAVIAGYERPAPGASWVQPADLFYAGPPPEGGSGEGVTIPTDRSCAPVEYRFDLYVEGVAVDSVTAPGVAATC